MAMSTSLAKQKRGIWFTVAGILAVITLFLSMFMYKMLSPRILSQEDLRLNRAIVFDTPREIKAFTLSTHSNREFTEKDLVGSWSLIYFGFTHCPDICPTTLAKLAQVVDQLDQELAARTRVILVSVDPARDTPESLAQYVTFFDPEFIGLTGDFRELLNLTGSLNVAFNKVMLDGAESGNKDNYTIDHTGHLALVNPNGHYHGFFKPPFELAAMKVTFSSIAAQF